MSSAETCHRVRVQNARERNPAVQQSVQLLPGLAPLLTATKQDVSPQYAQPVLEQRQPIGVARNRVVLVIAQYDLPQPLSDPRRRLVHPAAENCFKSMQLRHHPLLRRLAPDDECAGFLALPAVMREAQEREGLRLSLSTLLPVLSGQIPTGNFALFGYPLYSSNARRHVWSRTRMDAGVIRREIPGDSIDFAEGFAIKYGRPTRPIQVRRPGIDRYTPANISTR